MSDVAPFGDFVEKSRTVLGNLVDMTRDISWSELLTFWCGFNHQDDTFSWGSYLRVVYCNDPDNVGAVSRNYPGNYVSTTRYSLVNFIPKSLFEQFRRVANLYFLAIACVSYSPVAPFTPLSTFAPLVIVVGAAMTKEALEDWRRRKQDINANNRKVEVYCRKDHEFQVTRWKNVRVGNVVKVCKDQYFPADLFLLSSSYVDGICYVDTMNLDGETNLKLKQSLDVTSVIKDEKSLEAFDAVINCEKPNGNLFSFAGMLKYGGRDYPLSLRQILLRGSKLKNTDFIYGVAVFTGHDTKVMQNATNPPSKRSKIERKMDKIIYILFSILILISCIGSVIYGIETRRDLDGRRMRRWYLRPDESTSLFDPKRAPLSAFLHFLTGLMLYNYLIPISLYVSIEIVKVLQVVFINQDQEMYHKETNKPSRARTSNLNDDLGQVNTILSDKTGTLTCNSMEFVKCSIGGVAYGQTETEVERALARRDAESSNIDEEVPAGMAGRDMQPAPSKRRIKGFNFRDDRIMDGEWGNQENAEVIREFFRALATCHTVIPAIDRSTKEQFYEAESPDEAAFVVAAREIGFEFLDRKQTFITLLERDFRSGRHVNRKISILDILEYTSTRKRMSVIVRTEEGRLMLYSKGADSEMFKRLSEKGRRFETETMKDIKSYSQSGLRIMVVAYRELNEEEYRTWKEEIEEAKADLSADREEWVHAVADKIEKELILLGATAVEDKLQEGVQECIEMLAEAQINIWVLTGDKQETAINIGYACRLLRQQMQLIIVNLDLPEIVELERTKDREGIEAASVASVRNQLFEGMNRIALANKFDAQFGLIIDGKSLDCALSKKLEDLFLNLAGGCATVICCRSSPKQKALVTRLVKWKMGRTTVAVGDGANDVSMIQEADIGVGISGVEGMQAVLACDFSIAQFRFLERLLLVHGHWCYRRIAMMICYFFYKNIAFGFTLFWFEGYASFSGQPAYNDWYMSCFNVFFTSLPVIALGIFDQDVSAYLCLKYPFLYREGVKNILFSWHRILGWMANGLVSSVIIFFCMTNTMTYQALRKNGKVTDYEVLGIALYSSVVLAVNCQIALSINYFTWIHHLVIWGSIAFWYVFLMVYGSLSPTLSTTAYMAFLETSAPSILYWLCTVLLVATALLPYLSYRAFQMRFWPMPHDVIQQLHRDGAKGNDPGTNVPVGDERTPNEKLSCGGSGTP
ncbi:hypothetical protein MLD38_033952 [Melastoma candidum]|uniref:Uncharacterized protein n=1 Tax=Melastoma candidum TaxID=119954 RepID=A0ACB9M9R8_9MYRT|nr:hypothetical protein MLD38_033952 [Melastoma candidum]